MLLVRLRYSCSGPRSLLSVVYLFLSLTGGTPRRLVRHHRSGVQKKQDDTRQSSNGPRTRTPPTDVITACFKFIRRILSATFAGSFGSSGSGLPVSVLQNRQERVQISPAIINVAVPRLQHSPMFGHFPLVQMVCRQ